MNHQLNIIRKENHEKYIGKKENDLSDHNILNRRIDNTDVKASDIAEYKLNLIYEGRLNHEATWQKLLL